MKTVVFLECCPISCKNHHDSVYNFMHFRIFGFICISGGDRKQGDSRESIQQIIGEKVQTEETEGI
jgi:hypothetical protein